MKIAFDAQLFLDKEKTGIGWYGKNLIEILNKENQYEFQFNFFKGSDYSEEMKQFIQYLEEQQFKYSIVDCGKIKASIYRICSTFLPLSYQRLFGSGADITFFLNYIIPPKVAGKKVTMIHDMTYKAYPETQKFKSKMWLRLSMKRTCKRADHIITASEFSKSEIIKYFKIPEEKVKVLSCGVDTKLYHDQYTNSDVEEIQRKYQFSGEYYLYVGTIEPRKNIENLIKAYRKLLDKKKKLPKLVIVGKKGWLYDKIFKLVDELELKENVLFTGYVEEKEVPVFMYGAKIFIYPSLYEGFGMPPLEAMACKTAVITSNVASLPEVVRDAGIQVDPLSVDDIENAILQLEEDGKKRIELSIKGYERSKKFNWINVNKSVVEVINKLSDK